MPGDSVSSEDLAFEILEVVPALMHSIRVEMRKHRASDLSVVQFRALASMSRSPGISLAGLAEQVGLMPSSASALVDGLAVKGLVMRAESAGDRRRVELRLTGPGLEVLEAAQQGARESLAERLSVLPEADRDLVYRALKILRPLYGLEMETPDSVPTTADAKDA